MDLFSKIFRSTFGIDGQDQRNLPKPPENLIIDRSDDIDLQRPIDVFQHFHHVFADFDRMFANFGNIFESFPSAEVESSKDFDSQPESLRDQLLKQPDSEQRQPWRGGRQDIEQRDEGFSNFFGRVWSQKPYWNKAIQEKIDTDLDETVKLNGLDRVLDQPHEFQRPPQGHNSRFSRVSVNVRRNADGKIEQKRTTMDSDGNETTIITRSVGGKTFEQTTTKQRNGEVEIKEDWSNVDPEEQTNFKQRWNLFSAPRLEAPPSSGFGNDKLDDKTESIFEKLFGPRST